MDAHGIRYTLYRADQIKAEVLHELVHTHGRHLNDHMAAKPVYGGTHQDVSYRTIWFDGVLHLWVFGSPVVGHFHLCAPGACDGSRRAGLLEDGAFMGYDIPPDWRWVEPCELTFIQLMEKYDADL